MDEPMCDHGDEDRGGKHETDRAQGEAPEVGAHVAQVREEGGTVDQGRQEDHEHYVGIEGDRGDAGHEAE